MKKLLFLVATICCCFCLLTRCKKSDNKTVVTNPPTDTLAAFAQSLAASCTHSFAGAGDTTTFYLPTAFTPNGDGVNDVYALMGPHQSFSTYLLTIYKTNGVKVFKTTVSSTYWDGRNTTGSKCTDYKYFVKIKYTTPGNISVDTGTYLYLLPTDTVHGCITRVAADTVSYKFPDQLDIYSGLFSYPTNETFCN